MMGSHRQSNDHHRALPTSALDVCRQGQGNFWQDGNGGYRAWWEGRATHSVNLFLVHLSDSLVSVDTKAYPASRQVSCPLVWFEHCGCVGSQRQEGKRKGERRRGGERKGREEEEREGEGKGRVSESGQGAGDRT